MVGGVLVFSGASALGDTPDTRDTTAQVASYFRTNRTTVFVGCVLFGLMAKGLFELTLVATPLIALALAGLVGGTALGLARASSGRRWFVILSTAIAVAHLVGRLVRSLRTVLTRRAAAGLPPLAGRLAAHLGPRSPST